MKPRSLGTSAVAVKESVIEREAVHNKCREQTCCKVNKICPQNNKSFLYVRFMYLVKQF